MKRVIELWNNIETLVVGVSAFFVAMITMYSVIMRYVFKSAPEWATEVAVYLTVWATYFTCSTLVRTDGHVGATFFVDKFFKKYQRVIELIAECISLSFVLIVTYFGALIVKIIFISGETGQSSLRIPMWIATLAVPVGTFLMSIGYLLRIYRHLFGSKKSLT
jgi:C4-dicarboxylate transporter DctQ subunit